MVTAAVPPDTDRPATRHGTRGVRGVVARAPIRSFFVLAFALSWLAWTPYVLSGNGLGVLPFRFPEILGTTQLLGVLPGAYLGPIASAFVVTAVADGRAGVRRWTGRLLRWRVSWWWYPAVVLGVPLALLVTGSAYLGGGVRFPGVAVLVAYLPMLVLQMVTTGLAEEPGWRDFALPRLQPRFGPVRGTLLLGVLWGCWHLPLFLTEWGGWPAVDVPMVVTFVAAAVAFSFVITWVFNRSGESLPVAIVLHSGVNTFFTVAWSATFAAGAAAGTHGATSAVLLIASAVVAVVLLVTTRGRLGYRGPRP